MIMFICLCVYVLSITPVCISTVSININETDLLVELGPKQISRFNDIGSQEVFHWPAHPSSAMYLLRFSGTVNQSGSGVSVECPDANVSAYVRHQAIPLPNPRQATIPDLTFVHDEGNVYTGSFIVSRLSQGNPHDVIVQWNATDITNYFAAVFLPHDQQRIEVDGLSKECHYYVTLQVFGFNVSSRETSTENLEEPSGRKLIRKQHSLFAISFEAEEQLANVTTKTTNRFFWKIFPVTDSGGTLHINIKAFPAFSASNAPQDFSISGCLTNMFSRKGGNCTGDLLQLNNSLLGQQLTWHVPFPISGFWILDLTLDCTDEGHCNDVVQPVEVQVSVGTCIEGCQAHLQHGYCGLYRSDDVLFTACSCRVGWMGLACNDGRYALSYGTQLLHTLLLTLSNLMFVPCVILALYRKYYREALVYFFVCFMSSFYHACDQPGVVVYCLLPYETLQFSDFLSSITAIWFTLIAVAKLPEPLEAWLQVAGCLAFAVTVSYNRFNVWTTIAPAVIGVMLVILQWGIQCHHLKKCYPGLKRTLFSIVPGLICAVVGLVLYAFVETSSNYYIVHSMWHILMASAVLFLLPVDHKSAKERQSYSYAPAQNSPAAVFGVSNRITMLHVSNDNLNSSTSST